MMKNIAKALTPVAAAFGAATIALTPANDANAQSAAATASPDFAIGRTISVTDFPAMAERLGQASVARMDFIYEGQNGAPNTGRGVYVTANTETGRGWIFEADAPHGRATRVTPIYEIKNVVIFRHNIAGAGVERLVRASPTINVEQATQDCARWRSVLGTDRSCGSKNSYYNTLISQNAAVAMVGEIINGNPADANVFTIAHLPNDGTSIFGRMGNNAYITSMPISNYSVFPSVEQAFPTDTSMPVALLPTVSPTR